MCGKVVHCGAVGQGTDMKLFVNLLLGDVMAAFAEALVFGRATGLALEDMQTVVGSSGLASPLFEGKGAQIAARDFEARFPVDYQYKDLVLAQDRAGSVGAPVPLTAASREAFGAARAQGYGTDDIAAVVRHMAALADVNTTV